MAIDTATKPARRWIKLTNNFHNTSCRVWAFDDEWEGERKVWITVEQLRTAAKKLCVSSDCYCGLGRGSEWYVSWVGMRRIQFTRV